jgi:AcrR family transcriptional regulator
MARPRIHGEEARVRLIEEAARLLAERGPHALTTRAVCDAAGVPTSALYSLVGGKEELLRAVYREGFARLADALDAVAAGGEPRERLAALGAAYLDNALANPHLYRVMFACPAPEFVPDDDDVAFALSTLQTTVDQVQRCIDAGSIAGADAATIGTELWLAMHGAASVAVHEMLPEQAARQHGLRLSAALLDGYTPR